MSVWFSVHDILPPENTAVLIYGEPFENKPPMMTVAVIDRGVWCEAESCFGWIDTDCDGWTGSGFDDALEGVTHWTRLPEPPEDI